jgi:hypothetical protein
MATCISRRAHADRYTFRLINDKGQIGKHIWTEYRCPNVVSAEGTVCTGCSAKIPKYKYQAQQKCDHGQVGGPYPADSKLYGSAYYEREIKAGWLIAETDEIRAKAAVLEASMGRKKAVEQEPTVTNETLPVVPKKRAYNRKVPLKPKDTTPKDTTPKESEPETVKSEKKPGRPRKILPTETIKPIENLLEPKLIEIIAPPLIITDCVVVKVKKMRIEGKEYYHDSLSGKLYGVSVNGVGGYKGRYNAETKVIDTTFPDSDCE